MCNCGKNEYTPVPSKLQDIIKHTAQEWTFRFTYVGDVKPGQFFQISIPKVGECPISVSGIGPDYVDLTLRAVGKVTDYLFENFKDFIEKNKKEVAATELEQDKENAKA